MLATYDETIVALSWGWLAEMFEVERDCVYIMTKPEFWDSISGALGL